MNRPGPKYWPFLLIALALVFMAADAQDSQQSPATSSNGRGRTGFVVVCTLEDMIDEGLAVVTERAVEEAEGAEALVFRIDTPGGLVDAAIKITDTIGSAPCPTIAYVEGMGAISAGALISFSCDYIMMAPGTNIGASTPVYFTSEGSTVAGEKEISFLRSKFAALAELNGHNADIGEAMVDPDVVLYAVRDQDGEIIVYSPYSSDVVPATEKEPSIEEAIGNAIEKLDDKTVAPIGTVKDVIEDVKDELERQRDAEDRAAEQGNQQDLLPGRGIGYEPTKILEKGKLLTLTSNEAEAYGLSRTTASSIDQALGVLEIYPVEKRNIELTLSEEIFRFLTNPTVTSVLLLLGFGGLFFELQTPGVGFPGIVSLIGFTLFFGSRAVLGLSEWIDVALIVIGVGLLVVELMILPGFGIAGIAGIACILAGIYLSFTLDGFQIPQYSWDYARIQEMFLSLVIALALTGLLLWFMWKVMKFTPGYSGLVLSHAQQDTSGYVVQGEEEESAVGMEGVAATRLRPVGKGRFGDKTLQVVSHAEYLEEGTPIRVVTVDGNRYVVEKIKDAK